MIDAAAGYRFNSWLRAEALLSWRPDLEFSGQSNFLGRAGANQPVTDSASSVAGFGVAWVSPATALAPLPIASQASLQTLPAGTTILIGGTEAALRAHGVQLSLRYSF